MELATLNATFLIRDDNRGDEESKFMGHTGVGKRSSHMQLELTKIYTTTGAECNISTKQALRYMAYVNKRHLLSCVFMSNQ